MRTYQPNYTKEFRDEQLKWFEERMEKLPPTLQINKASYTGDLARTVRGLMAVLSANKPSVMHSGYMETLMQIKDRLQEQGL